MVLAPALHIVLCASMIAYQHTGVPRRVPIPVAGTVVDAANGMPIAEVEVSSGQRSRTRTNARGEFRFDSLPDGPVPLSFRRVGFAALDTNVHALVAGATLTIRMRAVVQRLDPVVTEASELPRSYLDHKDVGLGTFVDGENLRQQDGRALADVIRAMRGVSLFSGPANRQWLASRRSTTSSGVYQPKGDEIARGVRTACYAQVYLDNMLMNSGSPASPFDVNTITVETLKAVEYYSGPAETPNKYARLNSTCGVLVLWTR